MLKLRALEYRTRQGVEILNLALRVSASEGRPIIEAHTIDGDYYQTLTVYHEDVPDGCVGISSHYPFIPQLLTAAGVIMGQEPVDTFPLLDEMVDCYELTQDAQTAFHQIKWMPGVGVGIADKVKKFAQQNLPAEDVRDLDVMVNARERTIEIMVSTTTRAGEDRVLEAFAQEPWPTLQQALEVQLLLVAQKEEGTR